MTISISNPGGGGGGGGLVADAINDGTTTVAPSQNAVFDALALKVPTSRTLAGLDLSADRTASTLRTALSLVPGTDVQAYDADLGQIAAATFADDDFVQKKAGSLTNRTIAQVKADLGGVATDAIFDAKGDLPVGTGADAAAKLTVGADGSSLTADSSAAAGVAWLGAVSIKAPKTGVDYSSAGIHTPETTLAGGAAPQSAANAQVATWFPCWVHKPVRPLLRSYCFTLEAGSSARFALWTLDHATIRPGTLIEDLGLMAGTSTGAKALSASTATVTGWFFLAVWASNHTTVRWGRPTFDSSKCQMFGTTPKFPKRVKKQPKFLTQQENSFLIDTLKVTIRDVENTQSLLKDAVAYHWENSIPGKGEDSERSFKMLNEAKTNLQFVNNLLKKFAAIQHKLKTQR